MYGNPDEDLSATQVRFFFFFFFFGSLQFCLARTAPPSPPFPLISLLFGSFAGTHVQRAIGLATQRMLEEHLYFALLSDAFHLPEGWTYTQQTFDFIPQPVRAMVKRLARRAICDQTLAQVRCVATGWPG